MRSIRRMVSWFAPMTFAFLMACGQGAAFSQTEKPGSADVLAALQYSQPTAPPFSNGPLSPIYVHAEVGACTKGMSGSTEVDVCKFCAVAVQQLSSGDMRRGTYLSALRFTGSVPLKRAISLDQPDIDPVKGERGVFVPLARYRWTFDREYAERPLLPMSMRRAGYQPITGLALVAAESQPISPQVRSKFLTDATLRQDVLRAVPACQPPQ